jgi:Family of unknown function (DUF6295)
MCTYIVNSSEVTGGGKGADGWFALSTATVGFDHPTFTSDEHAIMIDFTNRADLAKRVAVELDIDSARGLLATLTETIRAAEESGVA